MVSDRLSRYSPVGPCLVGDGSSEDDDDDSGGEGKADGNEDVILTVMSYAPDGLGQAV